MVNSRVEERYGKGMLALEAARRHITHIRVVFADATPGDIVANVSVAKDLLYKDLPPEIELATAALKGYVRDERYSFGPLKQVQIDEYLTAIRATNPVLGKIAAESSTLTDDQILQLMIEAMFVVQKQGSYLVEVASGSDPDNVQVARAELLISMARLDILFGYFVILAEGKNQ